MHIFAQVKTIFISRIPFCRIPFQEATGETGEEAEYYASRLAKDGKAAVSAVSISESGLEHHHHPKKIESAERNFCF